MIATESTTQKANSIFSRFVENVRQMNLNTRDVALLTFLGGGALSAVGAMTSTLPDINTLSEFSGFLAQGASGLNSLGENIYATGIVTMLAGPMLAAAYSFLNAGFIKIKLFISEKIEQIKLTEVFKADLHQANAPGEEALNLILREKLDPNARLDGKPLLNMAIAANHYDLVKALIEKGADINAYDIPPSQDGGMASIHFAKNAKMVGILSEAGVKLDTPYLDGKTTVVARGETALQSAVLQGRVELAEALVKSGAKPNLAFSKEYADAKIRNLDQNKNSRSVVVASASDRLMPDGAHLQQSKQISGIKQSLDICRTIMHEKLHSLAVLTSKREGMDVNSLPTINR